MRKVSEKGFGRVREQADSKRRLNIILPEKSWSRLERLRDALEADTFTEVVKDCFRLMEYVLDVEESGSKILLKRPTGELVELEVFQFSVK